MGQFSRFFTLSPAYADTNLTHETTNFDTWIFSEDAPTRVTVDENRIPGSPYDEKENIGILSLKFYPMNIIIKGRPSVDAVKIRYSLEWGRKKGQRTATGIFTYAKPKTQVEKNHNMLITYLVIFMFDGLLLSSCICNIYSQTGRQSWLSV
jgi:hypothetical protein